MLQWLESNVLLPLPDRKAAVDAMWTPAKLRSTRQEGGSVHEQPRVDPHATLTEAMAGMMNRWAAAQWIFQAADPNIITMKLTNLEMVSPNGSEALVGDGSLQHRLTRGPLADGEESDASGEPATVDWVSAVRAGGMRLVAARRQVCISLAVLPSWTSSIVGSETHVLVDEECLLVLRRAGEQQQQQQQQQQTAAAAAAEAEAEADDGAEGEADADAAVWEPVGAVSRLHVTSHQSWATASSRLVLLPASGPGSPAGGCRLLWDTECVAYPTYGLMAAPFLDLKKLAGFERKLISEAVNWLRADAARQEAANQLGSEVWRCAGALDGLAKEHFPKFTMEHLQSAIESVA